MRFLCVLFLTLISLPLCAYADKIVLKSGKTIEGRIIEKTRDYVRVESQGNTLYFENRFIQEIKEDSPESPRQDADKPDTLVGEEDKAGELNSLFESGLRYAAEGDFDKAQEQFTKASELDKSDNNVKGALGILDDLKKGLVSREYVTDLFKGSYSLMNEDYAAAVSSLENALKSFPDDPDVLYNLAMANYYLENHQKAVEYIQKVLSFYPNDPEAYWLMGNARLALFQYEEARECILKAKELFEQAKNEQGAKEAGKLLDDILSHMPVDSAPISP